jgi:hypothetical protein
MDNGDIRKSTKPYGAQSKKFFETLGRVLLVMRRRIIILCITTTVVVISVCLVLFIWAVGDVALPAIYACDTSTVWFYTDINSARSFTKSTKIRRRINASVVMVLSDFQVSNDLKYDHSRFDKVKYPLTVSAKSYLYSLQYESLRTGMTFHVKTDKENIVKSYDDMIENRIGTNFRWGIHPFDNVTPPFLEYVIFDYKWERPLPSHNGVYLQLKDESGNILKNSGTVISVGNE